MKSFSEIEEICRKYYIYNYTINDDGSIDVDGNVDLSNRDLTELPLTFGRVTSHFNCSYNKLTTLKGSPKYVGYNFYCDNNELTSLEFGPEEVKGDFLCQKNKIMDLYGMETDLDGNFYCADNPIGSILTMMDKEFIHLFKSFKIVNGNTIHTKRFKYLMEKICSKYYNLNKIKKFYTLV